MLQISLPISAAESPSDQSMGIHAAYHGGEPGLEHSDPPYVLTIANICAKMTALYIDNPIVLAGSAVNRSCG
jgi:hypothetical protein